MTGPTGEFVPGSLLAGYRVVRLLGAGGMGAVYLAQHPRLPRQDALKILYRGLSEDSQFRLRFEREAHLAAQLDHPNVVTVYDRGTTDGVMWLAMQYVPGADVATLLRNRPAGLDPDQALDILIQAARGIDAAHRQGMLHRDVKPANLLVTPGWNGRPDSQRVLVGDFGIARADESQTALTQTGTLLGTLAYAAPELLESGVVDQRADVYALGCTFYQMLTGSVAFPRSHPMAVMNAHATAPPPRATATHPALPAAIDAVIATALAKDPNARYRSAGALAEAATAALRNPTLVYRHPEPEPPPTRRRVLIAVVATLLVAVAAGGAYFAFRPDDTSSTSAPTTTVDVPQSIVGTWTGAVSGDETGFDVVADITTESPLTASVSYPQLGCSGEWRQADTPAPSTTPEPQPLGTFWRLTETIDTGTCVPSTVTLTRNDDGTLAYSSTYFSDSQNRNFTIHATLTR